MLYVYLFLYLLIGVFAMSAAAAAFDDDAMYVIIIAWPVFLLLMAGVGVVVAVYELGKTFGEWILKLWRKHT